MHGQLVSPLGRTSLGLDLASLGLAPIRRADRPRFEQALGRLREPLSDATFWSLYCWSEALAYGWTELWGHLCVFSLSHGECTMSLGPLPLGEPGQDTGEALAASFELMERANERGAAGLSAKIHQVSDEIWQMLSRVDPGLEAAAAPGDYVYPRRALAELDGSGYKNRRKLRSRFLRDYPGASTAPIGPGDVGACGDLLDVWRSSADQKQEGVANEDLVGVDELRRCDRLSTLRYLDLAAEGLLPSMAVRSGDELLGFTIGEWTSPMMASVAVEKTAPGVVGAPQFIYSAFCATALADASEINAGDDWGIASLRYTKESWRPSRMLRKWSVARTGALPAMDRAIVHRLVFSRPAPAPLPEEAAGAVRNATRADLSSVIEVERLAFAAEGDRFSRAQVRRLIDNPRARVGVALDGAGDIVGWCVALIRSHSRWDSGRVYSVAVRPDAAGRGTGRRLLAWMLASLEEAGVERVYLEARAENRPAIALYNSAGFVPIRTLPNYYGDADGVRMRRIAPRRPG